MAKVALYNEQGKEAGDIELNDAVFAVEANKNLVHQVYLALEANARQPWAHTKDKSDVRGGGKKPWKQKGTGRARHGSNRSPIWKGGGVTFGPLSTRNYKQKINRKMNQKAVRMCLSDKVAEGQLIVLEAFDAIGKTKQIADLRNSLPGAGKSTLLLSVESNEKLNLATRNVAKLDLQRVADVNVVDLLHHQFVIATKADVEALEKRLA
jgi:large subunit ribosomal protein L4